MTDQRRNIIAIIAVITLGLGLLAIFLVVQEALKSQAPDDSSADIIEPISCDEGCNANICSCPSSCGGGTIGRGEFCRVTGGGGGGGGGDGGGGDGGGGGGGAACVACVSVAQFGSCAGAGREPGNGGACGDGQVCCGNLITSPPPPADTRSQCGGACNSDADCRPAANGAPVTCRNGICENATCSPGKTIPGANCNCSDLNACGQPCGAVEGLCQPGSVCKYISGPSCGEGTQTYCVPVNPPAGWSLLNCVDRDQSNGYILFNGRNPTVQEILSACNPTCTNGATNYPSCNICPSGQVLVNGQCVNNCTNGAVNPPECNQCPAGYTFADGQCVAPCTNGTMNPPSCNQCPTGLTFSNHQCICANGATNAPTCNVCPAGELLIDGVCQEYTLPDTAIIDEKTDPILFGILFLILGAISMKINLPLKALELFYETDLKYIFAPFSKSINEELKVERQVKAFKHKKKKLAKDRKKFEDKFKV